MTSAGKFLDHAYEKAKQGYEMELQEIEDSLEETLREPDHRAMAALHAERQDIVLRREKVLQEQEEIKTDFQELRARKMKEVRSESARAAHGDPSYTNGFDRAGFVSDFDVDARTLEPPSRQVTKGSSQPSSLDRMDALGDILGDTATVIKTSRNYTPSEPLRMGTLRGSVGQNNQRAMVARCVQSVKDSFENLLYG